MRRRSFRLSIAGVLVAVACGVTFALVSAGQAGSGGASLILAAHPATLSANQAGSIANKGFVKAAYTAAPGPQTGAATHVVIRVTLDPALVFDQADSSPNCVLDSATADNDVVCTVGTVQAGTTATRFVAFVAPETAGSYTINGEANQDNGNGGVGTVDNPIPGNPVEVNVVAAGDPNSAGNCLFKPDSVSTPAPIASDNAQTNQSTRADVGTVQSSLGIPCAYADVGEDATPPGFVTAISHNNIAQLTAPAKITITLASLPVPFSQIVWRFFPNYVSPTNLGPAVTISACNKDGTLPAGKDVCSLTPTRTGRGGVWQFLQRATGSDPGYGA